MPCKIDLSGKNILVTGGSMGIGLATAKICLESKGKVVICARNKGPIDEAIQRLQKNGHQNISGIVCDVTKIEEIEKAIDKVESDFGPLTSVIHCAAVIHPIGPITDVDPEDWLQTIHNNLFGTFLIVRQSALRLRKNGCGRVVLFSGGGGSYPFPNFTAYAASKVGVVRFTESVALELEKDRIEINCVAPGFVATRMQDETLKAGKQAGEDYLEKTKALLKKGAIPPEVGARAAAFFISDAAQGISGKFISAQYDGWENWSKYLQALKEKDIFTLRRIVPKDRGFDWQ